MATKEKKPQVLIWTPLGQFSFPYFAEPDRGRQYSDGQFKTDLFTPKAIFKDKGKALQEAVLQVGRDHFGTDFKLTSAKYRIPLKDTDKDDDVAMEAQKNCIMMRAKAGKKDDPKNRPPTVLGPRKVNGVFPVLTKEEVGEIKGGDWGRLHVAVYPYDGNKQIVPGVSFSLRGVQFAKVGEGYGQGNAALYSTIEEIEEELEDVGNAPEVEDGDEDSIV